MEVRIRTHGLQLTVGGRDLVQDADWTIREGERWALWGPNGAGKSTLLRVLAGEVDPQGGTVRRGPGLRVVRVDQDATPPPTEDLAGAVAWSLGPVREAEAGMRAAERAVAAGQADVGAYARALEAFERAGGYRAEARLRRELAEALPGRPDATPTGALTAGERRRLALAAALAARPDLLLLDEPSNGLDVHGRRWLADRVRTLPRHVAVVIASHDRDLLGRTATASARLDSGRLETSTLPFDRDRARRGALRRSAARRARVASREKARLEAAAERARGHGSPSRAAAARALARRAARWTDALADAAAERSGDADRGDAAWSLPDGRPTSGPVLVARDLRVRGAFDTLDLSLDAGDKVVLLGRDDAGTSALLEVLAAERRSDDPGGRVWLRPGARLHHWDARRRGLGPGPIDAQLAAWVPAPRVPQLLSLVSLPRERASAPPAELSGGERARAAVALLVAREPDVVLLDAPETDLDLAAIELLEQALADASGTVVLATHDLRLAEAVGADVRCLEGGRLVAYRGGVDGWRQGRRRTEASTDPPAVLPDETADAGSDADRPAEVDALEDEQAAVEAALMDPLALPERERARLAARRRQLEAARMAAYDARLPPPAPRYRATEPPLTLAADADARRGLAFVAPDWPTAPVLRLAGDVAHLALPEPDGACWAPWARAAALRAALSLIVPLLAPAAVQTPAGHGPPPAPFVALDDAWWVATRPAYERWAGIGRRARASGRPRASAARTARR